MRASVWDALGAVAHLRVALLRPAERLDASGDIDLLVDAEQFDEAVDALCATGFRRLDHGDPAEGHLVAHDVATATFAWIHLQTRVRAPGVELDTEPLLRSARVEDGVPVIADEWLFWVLVVHTVFEQGSVSDRHRPQLTALAPAGRLRVVDVRGPLAAAGCDAVALLEAIEVGDWDAAGRQAAHLPAAVPWSERLRGRAVGLRRAVRTRGLSVAAIGPDGAGKTSLMTALEATLPVPTRRLYLGLTGGRLPAADRLRIPGLVLLARLALLWARHLVTVVERWRGRVVLVDRHVLDGRVPSGVSIGPFRRRGRRLESRAVPAPDLLFVLDAPGEVLHHRSGEYDPATLEGWRAAYRRIAAAVDRSVVLDATAPVDDVLRIAQAEVWAALAERVSPSGAV